MNPVTLKWQKLEIHEKEGVLEESEKEKTEYANKLSHSKII